MNAIFAMGLIGAGTNNARLAQMLRQLAGYYQKEADCLFVVRIAQGLVHMGKGTIGLNPFHSDRSIMSKTAVAGLLSTLVAFIDAKQCTSAPRPLHLPSRLTSALTRPLAASPRRSHPRQVALDALLPRLGHVPALPDHARRGAPAAQGDGKSRPGAPLPLSCVLPSSPASGLLTPAPSPSPRRRSTSSARPVSRAAFPASSPTRRRCASRRRTGPSSGPRSTLRLGPCSRASSSCARTRGTTQRSRWRREGPAEALCARGSR